MGRMAIAKIYLLCWLSKFVVKLFIEKYANSMHFCGSLKNRTRRISRFVYLGEFTSGNWKNTARSWSSGTSATSGHTYAKFKQKGYARLMYMENKFPGVKSTATPSSPFHFHLLQCISSETYFRWSNPICFHA